MGVAAFAVLLLLGADWTPLIKPMEKAVVRLEMRQGDDTGSCSGSVIDAKRGYVLTAAHCIPDASNGEMSLTVNRRDAQVLKVNRILDLAILHFAPKGETQMELAEETPPSGTEVMVMGYGLGTKTVVTQFGRISQTVTDDGNGVWFDAMVMPGDSGGPVIDTLGRQVALTAKIIYSGPTHISHGVRAEDIRDFVGDYAALPTK